MSYKNKSFPENLQLAHVTDSPLKFFLEWGWFYESVQTCSLEISLWNGIFLSVELYYLSVMELKFWSISSDNFFVFSISRDNLMGSIKPKELLLENTTELLFYLLYLLESLLICKGSGSFYTKVLINRDWFLETSKDFLF